MVKFYDEIPDFLLPWIKTQKIFWVASAPLSPHGRVNLSPKGFADTFHIESQSRVWYEDLTGSGVETISHIRETATVYNEKGEAREEKNGRLVIMFVAFEGPPRIVRLWGKGSVSEFGQPEYERLIPVEKRHPGSRSVIMLDIDKVSSSCGYSIPFFTFKADRYRLHNAFARRELKDVEAFDAYSEAASCSDTQLTNAVKPPVPSADAYLPILESNPSASTVGVKAYWMAINKESIDGLPGLLHAYDSTVTFDRGAASQKFPVDDESEPPQASSTDTIVPLNANKSNANGVSKADNAVMVRGGAKVVKDSVIEKPATMDGDTKAVLGFLLGIVFTLLWTRLIDTVRSKGADMFVSS